MRSSASAVEGTCPLRFFTALRAAGEVAHFSWQGRPACVINEPVLIEEVLAASAETIDNPLHEYAELTPILTPAGRRLLALQRSGATPGDGDGTPDGARASFDVLEACVLKSNARLFRRLDHAVRDGAPIDAVSWLKTSFLQTFTRLLFDVEADAGAVHFQRAAALHEEHSVRRRAGTEHCEDRAFAWAVQEQESFARGVLLERWRALGGVEAGFPSAGGLSKATASAARLARAVRAITRTLLNAYNAMATTAAWALYLLARHPEIQERVAGEVVASVGRDAPGEDAGHLRLAATRNMPLLRHVIDETLRLYPSAWLLGRTARTDYRSTYGSTSSVSITAGTSIYICPYALHREPRFWHRPDAFWPERFATADPARPRAAYLPFGGGGRRCPAKALSTPLLMLLLAAWVERYETRLVDGASVRPWPLISLRPHPGVPLELARR